MPTPIVLDGSFGGDHMAQDGSRRLNWARLPLTAMVVGRLCRELTPEDQVAKPDVRDRPYRAHGRARPPVKAVRQNSGGTHRWQTGLARFVLDRYGWWAEPAACHSTFRETTDDRGQTTA